MKEVIETTESLCPICLNKLKAFKVKEVNNIYLEKKCEKHGEFRTIIWRGLPKYEKWKRPKTPAYPKKTFVETSKGCPYDCGLCSEHRQHT